MTESVAITGIRHGVRHGLRINDIELGINGDTEPEIVNRLIRPTLTRSEFHHTGFDIGDSGIDIPKTIITLEGLRHDMAGVPRRA